MFRPPPSPSTSTPTPHQPVAPGALQLIYLNENDCIAPSPSLGLPSDDVDVWGKSRDEPCVADDIHLPTLYYLNYTP